MDFFWKKITGDAQEARILAKHADIVLSQIEGYVIILLDKDGYIQNWNKGAEKIKGYQANEVIGQHIRLFFTQEDQLASKPEQLIQHALQHGVTQDEGARQRKDGSIIWVSTTITAIRDGKGNIVGLSKVTHDLTQRHREEKLMEIYVNDMDAKNKEMSQITYVASHDLQSPLKTITNYTNLLYEEYKDELDESANKYLHVIINSVERMKALIKDMLDFSRIGQERQQTLVDGNRMVRNILDALSYNISEANAIFEIGQMPNFNGYKVELDLLFQNLIDNALKFRKPGVAPHIRIFAQKEKNNWKFGVQDNGIGIEEKYLLKVFEIFQRLNARSDYEGTGIGLAHCAKVVALHGGKIWVDSIVGQGSTFYFTIPNYHIDETKTELYSSD